MQLTRSCLPRGIWKPGHIDCSVQPFKCPMRRGWATPRIMSLGAGYDTCIVSVISYCTFANYRVRDDRKTYCESTVSVRRRFSQHVPKVGC